MSSFYKDMIIFIINFSFYYKSSIITIEFLYKLDKKPINSQNFFNYYNKYYSKKPNKMPSSVTVFYVRLDQKAKMEDLLVVSKLYNRNRKIQCFPLWLFIKNKYLYDIKVIL